MECVKMYDYGQDVHFYHKMKHKAADKILGQCFLKELKLNFTTNTTLKALYCMLVNALCPSTRCKK